MVTPSLHLNTVAIIPAYNEERFIGSVVLKAKRYVDRVIVVDDGSTDDAAEIARLAGAIVVKHERNRGKGEALNTGFQKAREFTPQALVLLDGDGQHCASEIPAVLEPILHGDADVVVGSRYLNGDRHVPRHRVIGHWAFTAMTNILSGVHLSDSQNGFRAFSRRALEAVDFSSKGFSVESEMQFLVHEYHLKVAEVPVTTLYQDRPKRSVIAQGLSVLRGILRMVGQHRPLVFFGLPGMALLLAGMLRGVWVAESFSRTHLLAVGNAMICVLFSILGAVALSTGIILHSVRGLLLDLVKDRRRE